MTRLPGYDAFFQRFFQPWYSVGDPRSIGPGATRIGSCGDSASNGRTTLTALERDESAGRIASLLESVVEDWPTFLPVDGSLGWDWIDAFDRRFDEHRIASIIARSDSTDPFNECLVLCCEYGAAIGRCLIQASSDLEWAYARPYWESVVIQPHSGCRMRVFDRAIRRFSGSPPDALCSRLFQVHRGPNVRERREDVVTTR